MVSRNICYQTAEICRTWPVDQQERWLREMAPEIGRGLWRPVTQYQVGGVYSRYLEMARRDGHTEIRPSTVREWVREAEARECSARTIAGYMWALYKIQPILFDQRPEWLSRTCLRIDRIAEMTPKQKTRRFVSAEAILQFGLETVARARQLDPSRWKNCQLFRDGLILLFGIYGPERLRALASVTLDDIDLQRYLATYPSSATKNATVSHRLIPSAVGKLVREWIDCWRQWHVRDQGERQLWIGYGGRGLGAPALTIAMKNLTSTAPWGFAITPHRFRDAAATLLVEENPQVARLATIILGHTSERMTREYTEKARQVEASRRGRALLEAARKKAS